MVLPAIQEVHDQLNKDYHEIVEAMKQGNQLDRINKLKKVYKVTSDKDLLLALKPHPVSVALAQAAMESSWGTSRFFLEANNVFGIWSFNKKEPRIAAGDQRGAKTIWLKKYKTIKDSVEDYYKNMGRSFAFKEFRKERLASNNPYILVTKLNSYSEKGALYGKELTSMLSYNKFIKKYDSKFFERPKKPKKNTSDIEATTSSKKIEENTKVLPKLSDENLSNNVETAKETDSNLKKETDSNLKVDIKKEKES